MVFSLSALWWRRIRGLWKLPDGRDWLRGKLGLVLIGGAMLSNTLMQFSFVGWVVFPPCYLIRGRSMVELLNIVASFKRSQARTVACSAPNPAAGHHQPTPPPGSPGYSWASLGQSLVGSLLLSPGSWCTQGFVYDLQESISQYRVSYHDSMVGLMATSSKRAYAIPRSTAPRAPAPVAVHCWPVPLQETHTVLSQSLWGLWVLLCTRFVWALWASLASMGFDYKCDFAPPIALLGLLLYPWTWSISLKLLQRHTATVPAPCSYVFMIIQTWNYAEVHHQMIAFSKFLILLYCCCFVTKSCLSLCNPMDCSPPGSCVHGMFQARILEQMATSYSRRSSQPRDWLHVSCISCISKWILYH